MGATRNTGYLENLIAYDASNNVAIATTAIDNAFKITMGGSVKMTGALSGTSATFSSSVTANGTLIAGLANGNIRLKGSTDGFLGVGESNGTLYLTDWTTGAKGLSIVLATGAATFSSSVTATSELFINGTDGGGKILKFTGGTTKYNWMIAAQQNVNNALEITPSSAAGGSTFSTPAVVVTSGGNVGIGTSSPTARLQIAANAGVDVLNVAGYDLLKWDTGDIVTFGGYKSSQWTALVFSTSGSERMRITSGGNVLIGKTTNAGGKLQVSNGTNTFNVDHNADGAYLTAATDNNVNYKRLSYDATEHFFLTSATERMRITSGGNVLIGGTTAASVRLGTFAPNNTSSSYSFVAWNNSGNDIFAVRGDGIIQAVGTYNNTTSAAANVWVDTDGSLRRSTSSLKYKNNIQSYDKGLDVVSKLRPVYYNGINDGKTLFAGLIAEEVHDLGLTEFVQYAEDGSPDALAYQNMVALLTKAIQEQQAQIEELKSKLN